MTILISVLAVAAQAQTVDPELVRLRHDYAMRFFEPASHMALAKYFRDKGNAIQAFYILENARRNRFPVEDFDAAYLLHFGGFRPLDNSKAEEAKYLALQKSAPDDIAVLDRLADIYVSRDDFAKAEPLFRLILSKDPANAAAVRALAEIYSRQSTPEKATTILADFERKYPESAAGYDMRIRRSMENDPSAASKLIAEALAKYPEDGHFWFYKAILTRREKKIAAAEEFVVKAAELAGDSVEIQGYTASFFRVEKRDGKTALKYYLKTYFLDPHAHFDGFAEAKIAGLNGDLSRERVQKLLMSRGDPRTLLADPNPVVVTMALGEIIRNSNGRDTELFVEMMRHDDTAVRWTAMQFLMANADAAFDKRLTELLSDKDLRVRGLAAYIAVHRLKQNSFPEMRKMLSSEAQLIRFDAVSALVLFGGAEGRELVLEHRKAEPAEYLRRMIDLSPLPTDGTGPARK